MSARDVYVLGVHSSHDASVCLLRNGEIVCAIEKERITRSKHDWGRAGLNELAAYCLEHAGIRADDIDCIVASEINNVTGEDIFSPREHRISHHAAHAWAVVGLSGFDDCAVMILDGEGSRIAELDAAERSVAEPPIDFYSEKESHYLYKNGRLTPLVKHTSGRGHESKFSGTDGVGSPYWYLSQLFFGREHCESKAMGLSAYGFPTAAYEGIIQLKEHGRTEIAEDWIFRLGLPAGDPARMYTDYASLAASIQAQLEAAIIHKARWLRQETGSPNLCFAGGVALNCVANGALAKSGAFPRVFVPFGPGDSSISIGCAYYGWQVIMEAGHAAGSRASPYLGRQYTDQEVIDAITVFSEAGLVDAMPNGSVNDVVDCIIGGDVAAVYDGRSEFGPRSLGNRSILADPRRPEIRDVLNRRVKFREPFRPFAAAVLAEHASDWFEAVPLDADHMQYVARIRPDRVDLIPGVAHVDGTSRIQVVKPSHLTPLHDILTRFLERSGVPILLNTSFNVQEPIVETPFEALKTFVASRMDLLYLQGHRVRSRCVLQDEVPPDLNDATLVWHEDYELVAGISAGTYGIVPTAGRERTLYQGWNRTVSVHRELPIHEETFELLRAVRPKRNAIIPMQQLASRVSDRVRLDFERTLLPMRLASVLNGARS